MCRFHFLVFLIQQISPEITFIHPLCRHLCASEFHLLIQLVPRHHPSRTGVRLATQFIHSSKPATASPTPVKLSIFLFPPFPMHDLLLIKIIKQYNHEAKEKKIKDRRICHPNSHPHFVFPHKSMCALTLDSTSFNIAPAQPSFDFDQGPTLFGGGLDFHLKEVPFGSWGIDWLSLKSSWGYISKTS